MKYAAQSEIWKLEQALGKTSDSQSLRMKSRTLGRFHQVFPLTLFPDRLIIEEKRVVWFQNNGPWTSNLTSTMATDIASVNSSVGPFFGHVHVKSLTGGPEILIDRLTKHDVYEIRSLIEGIALASRNGLAYENRNLESEREALISAGSVN